MTDHLSIHSHVVTVDDSDIPAIKDALGKSCTGSEEVKREALLALRTVLLSEAHHTPEGNTTVFSRCPNGDDEYAIYSLVVQESLVLSNLPGAALGDMMFGLVGPLSRLTECGPSGPAISVPQDTAVRNILAIYQKACDEVSAAGAPGRETGNKRDLEEVNSGDSGASGHQQKRTRQTDAAETPRKTSQVS
jgi:hypothetical protein